MSNKRFEIEWVDEVHRAITIEAKDKMEALDKILNGDFDGSKVETTDATRVTDREEMLANMHEVDEEYSSLSECNRLTSEVENEKDIEFNMTKKLDKKEKEVKSCPYCGADAVVMNALGTWVAYCSDEANCGNLGFVDTEGNNREDIISKWDQRASLSKGEVSNSETENEKDVEFKKYVSNLAPLNLRVYEDMTDVQKWEIRKAWEEQQDIINKKDKLLREAARELDLLKRTFPNIDQLEKAEKVIEFYGDKKTHKAKVKKIKQDINGGLKSYRYRFETSLFKEDAGEKARQYFQDKKEQEGKDVN